MRWAVGTYTRDYDAEGIYFLDVDEASGDFQLSLAATIENPSWIASHPELPVLYSVIETNDDGAGGVAVIDLGDPGQPSVVDEMSSLGGDPCHLLVANGLLVASNYSGGNLAAWRLDGSGRVVGMESLVQHSGSSVDPMRQKGPHVHSAAYHAPSETIFVCDLGLDRVYRYSASARGVDVMSRKTMTLKPGAGPRMMCIDPDARYGYVVTELDNTVVSFDLQNDRPVELATVSTLPGGMSDASYCGHIAMSAGGEHLYVSNRGHDSVAVFAVLADGELALIEHVDCGGKHPRFFTLTPDGSQLWVANRDSDNIVVFERNAASGRLTDTGVVFSVPAPVCLVPLGQVP